LQGSHVITLVVDLTPSPQRPSLRHP
jgi:hypothetical protein